MLKQIAILLVLVVAVVLGKAQVAHLLHGLSLLNDQLNVFLGYIFSGGTTGVLIKQSLALLMIPALLLAVPMVGYATVYRSKMPKVFEFYSIFLLLTVCSVALTL